MYMWGPSVSDAMQEKCTKFFDESASHVRLGAIGIQDAWAVMDAALTDPSIITQKRKQDRHQLWRAYGHEFNATSARMETFRRNPKCVRCGVEGTVFTIERHVNENSMPYLNLYGFTKTGQPSMLTVDHIVPDSLCGKYSPLNFRTMCFQCNSKRSDSISLADIETVEQCPSQYVKSWADPTLVVRMMKIRYQMERAMAHTVSLATLYKSAKGKLQKQQMEAACVLIDRMEAMLNPQVSSTPLPKLGFWGRVRSWLINQSTYMAHFYIPF